MNLNKKWIIRLIRAGSIISIIIFFILSMYLIESRYFLIGRTLYPIYSSINDFKSSKNELVTPITDTIVYCDYYAWHNDKNWSRGYSNTPKLGFYDSSDPYILSQHSKLANEYGIDVFKIEYIPQFDDSIINSILNADLENTKVCLMYDTMLRFSGMTGGPPYDFDDPLIYETFVDDMNHIAENYFSHKNYFKIKERPVLWIYVVRDFEGNYRKAISEVRNNMLKKGFDVYLVGDVVFWNYDFWNIRSFDAISLYSAYAGRPQNTADFTERLKFLYMAWRIIAQSNGKDFIPGAIPAYDDTCLSSERECVPPLSG